MKNKDLHALEIKRHLWRPRPYKKLKIKQFNKKNVQCERECDISKFLFKEDGWNEPVERDVNSKLHSSRHPSFVLFFGDVEFNYWNNRMDRNSDSDYNLEPLWNREEETAQVMQASFKKVTRCIVTICCRFKKFVIRQITWKHLSFDKLFVVWQIYQFVKQQIYVRRKSDFTKNYMHWIFQHGRHHRWCHQKHIVCYEL